MICDMYDEEYYI
jgi:hypothetical protein